ncbi:MAG: exonuclease SbcCD subunit D [Chloroflexi bacterium]|nr:exonuclease SbcCD subunit D [Chloroflexota bacterium]MCC6895184.1 exonuclease SbcCD subunit D [Anaerolineae bacterium]
MTEPIRVLHFADIHVGMENYGKTDPQTGLSSRVVDFLHRLDEMIEFARENDVDLIIFAGDAFKTRAPNPTYQREFAHRIRDLSDLAPVVMLVGNHDLPPTMLKASSIEIYDTLRVPNVRVAADYEVFTQETKRGPVVVGSAPYPIRSRLLEDNHTAGMTIAQTDALLQENLTQILDDLAEQADRYEMPRLLTGHFTLAGAVFGSERAIMLGRDIQVLLSSVADPRWDYVAMGHIHKHQNMTRGEAGVPPVVYSGSMERIDFGEEGDPKGFCWVELSREKTEWRFVQLEARPFVTLTADLRTAENPTEQVLKLIAKHALRDAIVRLNVQLAPETEARLNEVTIRDELKRAGVSQMAAIRKQVEQPIRARLGGSPEGMTQEQLLERYLLSKETPPERRTELMDAAAVIFEGKAGD